jgi:hypothetical protein
LTLYSLCHRLLDPRPICTTHRLLIEMLGFSGVWGTESPSSKLYGTKAANSIDALGVC